MVHSRLIDRHWSHYEWPLQVLIDEWPLQVLMDEWPLQVLMDEWPLQVLVDEWPLQVLMVREEIHISWTLHVGKYMVCWILHEDHVMKMFFIIHLEMASPVVPNVPKPFGFVGLRPFNPHWGVAPGPHQGPLSGPLDPAVRCPVAQALPRNFVLRFLIFQCWQVYECAKRSGKRVTFWEDAPKDGYLSLRKWPLNMGMGSEASAAHPRPNLIWVLAPGYKWRFYYYCLLHFSW